MSEVESRGVRVRTNIERTSTWAPSWSTTVEITSGGATTKEEYEELANTILDLRSLALNEAAAQDAETKAWFMGEAERDLQAQRQVFATKLLTYPEVFTAGGEYG